MLLFPCMRVFLFHMDLYDEKTIFVWNVWNVKNALNCDKLLNIEVFSKS